MFPGDKTMTNSEQDLATGLRVSSESNETLTDGLRNCCINTINLHARFNPMMVCSECKHIIKCFKDKDAYDKYFIFCRSRKRQIAVGHLNEYYTIVFKSYDTFK